MNRRGGPRCFDVFRWTILQRTKPTVKLKKGVSTWQTKTNRAPQHKRRAKKRNVLRNGPGWSGALATTPPRDVAGQV
jgi:hypothetical protein